MAKGVNWTILIFFIQIMFIFDYKRKRTENTYLFVRPLTNAAAAAAKIRAIIIIAVALIY